MYTSWNCPRLNHRITKILESLVAPLVLLVRLISEPISFRIVNWNIWTFDSRGKWEKRRNISQFHKLNPKMTPTKASNPAHIGRGRVISPQRQSYSIDKHFTGQWKVQFLKKLRGGRVCENVNPEIWWQKIYSEERLGEISLKSTNSTKMWHIVHFYIQITDFLSFSSLSPS